MLLTGVSYNYRDILMNYVCNLRRLGIYDMLVIAAWDEEMYRFGFAMGLPIFYYRSGFGDGAGDMAYGSDGFKKVTKLKSRVVLQILRMGYDVTWTDTDIVLFADPFPEMAAMPSDFVVQSNAPSDEAVANGPLRINSGFYRVRSNPVTVRAMEEIVAHAQTSKLTEQPSFYVVLCGGKQGEWTEGPDACVYRAGDGGKMLRVQFLDRTLYPAGAVHSSRRHNASWPVTGAHGPSHWDNPELRHNPDGLRLLHNNWIKGVDGKTNRVIDRGLWFYDTKRQICDYSPWPDAAALAQRGTAARHRRPHPG